MLTTTTPAPRPHASTGNGHGPAAPIPPEERRALGKAKRAVAPLDGHAEFVRPESAREPLELLLEQSGNRVPELVPIRYGRMLESPFAYYRGAARVMAADLAHTPRAGLTVQLGGDAHVANFGLYGSPERRLVFDMNDFDETLPGPFEYDVKRLVASLEVAGRATGLSGKQRRSLTLAAGARYRTAMAEFAAARDIEVWYARIDTEELTERIGPQLGKAQRKRLAKALAKARSRDTLQAFGKLTEVVDGALRMRSDPPLIEPVRDLLSGADAAAMTAAIRDLIGDYRNTLQSDRRSLLERYRFVDMARKVVGVGSVGTRCWIVLLVGRDEEDPLLLQVKEAERSVHAEFLGRSRYGNQGQRVVAGQRVMQQSSDIFLGWLRTPGVDGVQRDFYVRQFRDWKGSLEIADLRPDGLRMYGELCAETLARAHARSGDRIAIAGYLGSSGAFEHAIADFATTYADVTEQDHRQLAEAAASGRVPVLTGT